MILTQSCYRRAFNKLTEQQKAGVQAAMDRLEAAFGHPHLHSGLGLRRFGNFFEARAGLGLRLLFSVQGSDLVLATVGNHNQIRAFVKEMS
jgi:hypothetical protein